MKDPINETRHDDATDTDRPKRQGHAGRLDTDEHASIGDQVLDTSPHPDVHVEKGTDEESR